MTEPSWVLLRGLARESGHWGTFPEEFASRTGRRVIPIDLPGTGEFRDLPSPRSIGEIAAFVRTQALARVDSPVRLLTVSLGAMVAFEWMRRHPEEIDGCVVVNTSSGNLSPFYHRLRWQVWTRFAKAVAIPTPRERERALVDILVNDPSKRPAILAAWTKLALERPIGFRTFANQLWAANRARVELPKSARGLILNGLGDRLVDPSCSTALALRTGWDIKRHPWGGHDLPLDDPEWVGARIVEWSADRSQKA